MCAIGPRRVFVSAAECRFYWWDAATGIAQTVWNRPSGLQLILFGLHFPPFDGRFRYWRRNADADPLPTVMEHAEGFGCAV